MTDLFSSPASTSKPIIPIPPGVLKGPADADHYRAEVGKYRERWYIDPLPACDIAPATDACWPSFSHIKKARESDWTYTSYKRVAQALEDDYSCLAGLGVERRMKRMLEINSTDMNRAFQRGTNIHTYLEMALRGNCDPTFIDGPDEPGAEYMPAVKDFLDAYQPELIAAEYVYIGRDLNGVGYGGTADCDLRIPCLGGTFRIDWKSRGADSKHGCYAEEAAQLAASNSADYVIVEGADGPMRQRVPAVDGGLIVSIKPDGVRLYPIQLEAAEPYWRSLHAFWVAQRDDKAGVGRQLAPRRAPRPATPDFSGLATVAADIDMLTALYKEAMAAGAWDDDLKAVFAARKQQLLAGAAA
jgi:hypothetical protein